jgi:hypothetical protein
VRACDGFRVQVDPIIVAGDFSEERMLARSFNGEENTAHEAASASSSAKKHRRPTGAEAGVRQRELPAAWPST